MDEAARKAALADTIKILLKKREWFIKRRKQMQWAWIFLSVTSLTSGFVASIFIALGWPDSNKPFEKPILIFLPAIASFCGTVLIHFRLREYWELRELGRVDIDELLVAAKFLPIEDETAFKKGLYQIEMKAVLLSRLQTTRFFAALSERKNEFAVDTQLPPAGDQTKEPAKAG